MCAHQRCSTSHPGLPLGKTCDPNPPIPGHLLGQPSKTSPLPKGVAERSCWIFGWANPAQKTSESRDGEKRSLMTWFRSCWAQSQASSDFSIT